MGLGGMGMGGHYCHMCASTHCHHIMGAQQQSKAAYSDMLRQFGAQQQGVQIGIVGGGGGGASSSGHLLVSDGSSTIGFAQQKPKINKKLLLLRR